MQYQSQLEKDLNYFKDAISKMEREELEEMLVQLAWKETTIEHIIDVVIYQY